MMTLRDVLSPEHVELALTATSADQAIAHTIGLLRRDERVIDWATFSKALQRQTPCRLADAGAFSICLPHARTDSVSELVMSASRLANQVEFLGARSPVRYIFCIGAPQAMASDYLRVAGAIMRIFSSPEAEVALHGADGKAGFVELLSQLEMKL